MNENEINYFLDEVTTKQELIESIEALRTELRHAMAPMMEPVYKKDVNKIDPKNCFAISEQQDYIYESDLNQYEKAVYLYMHHTTYAQSTNDIAKACSISTASVKRVVSKAMKTGYIMRAPFEPGYILTKFSEA